MMTRLESLAPDLADDLRRASPTRQRAASVAASEFAITRTGVDHPLVKKALEHVRGGGILAAKTKAELDALVARLDEEYFDLQQATEEGRISSDEYTLRFGQARAVAALSFAGGENVIEAAPEAIYEAVATVDDNAELTALIRSVLSTSGSQE
ncbi:MAG TPA: hypothetical protein VGJ05_10345 [Fimbriiglobus sp.]|jgi:hypothetical protein